VKRRKKELAAEGKNIVAEYRKQRVESKNDEGEIQRLKEALERKEKEVAKLRKRLEENSSIERLIKGLQEQAETQITALREELLQEMKELRKCPSEWKNKRRYSTPTGKFITPCNHIYTPVTVAYLRCADPCRNIEVGWRGAKVGSRDTRVSWRSEGVEHFFLMT